MQNTQVEANKKKARQALLVWSLFFAATVTINVLIPTGLGINLHDWTYSNAKGLLLFSVNYAGFFLIVPLVLTKGWRTFKKLSFIIPVAAAAVSVVLWYPLRYIATIAIIVYIYLHWRFDLSELGFRAKGWYAVPFLVGAMYTAHEISNPEYWYEGLPFAFVFIGVTLFAAIYLWRRSVVVIWLSDGFQWFLDCLL